MARARSTATKTQAPAEEPAEALAEAPAEELQEIQEVPRKGDVITTSILKVTPEKAHTWLQQNPVNRAVRQRAVNTFAGAISRGEWSVNGESIKFDRDGNLLDGQHRLLAIVEAGRAVELNVVQGLDPQAQDTIDTGARRTPANALQLHGFSDANNTAAIATFIFRYDRRFLPRTHIGHDPTVRQILDVLDDHEDLVRGGVMYGRSLNKELPIRVTVAGAAACLITRSEPLQAANFLAQVRTGENLVMVSPALQLRNRVIKDANQPRKMKPVEVLAIFLKAFIAWRTDTPVQLLSWKMGTEKFPQL